MRHRPAAAHELLDDAPEGAERGLHGRELRSDPSARPDADALSPTPAALAVSVSETPDAVLLYIEPSGDIELNMSLGVAVDGSGNVFVLVSGNNRIQKFDNNATFLTAWGSFGTGNGQFRLDGRCLRMRHGSTMRGRICGKRGKAGCAGRAPREYSGAGETKGAPCHLTIPPSKGRIALHPYQPSARRVYCPPPFRHDG